MGAESRETCHIAGYTYSVKGLPDNFIFDSFSSIFRYPVNPPQFPPLELALALAPRAGLFEIDGLDSPRPFTTRAEPDAARLLAI